MKNSECPISADELAQMIDARYDALILYARSRVPDAAEDMVQEALLRLVDRARPENPVAWLFKTLRNEIYQRHRKTQRRQKYETEAVRDRVDWFLPKENPVFAREAEEKLRELPEPQKEIVLLRIWSGLSFEEIAELTEIPKTNVYRMYTTALEELRRQLS